MAWDESGWDKDHDWAERNDTVGELFDPTLVGGERSSRRDAEYAEVILRMILGVSAPERNIDMAFAWMGGF